MKIKIISCFFIFTMANANISHAYTVTCSNCSTVVTQLLEHVTSLEQLEQVYLQVSEAMAQTQQQITMVAQNIQRYENMIKNTIALPMDTYNALMSEYERLKTLYANLDLLSGDLEWVNYLYSAYYPNFGSIIDDYNNNWSLWSAQLDTSNQALIEVTSLQIDELKNDNSNHQDKVNELLTAPEGRMEALQAGNQLSAMHTQELKEFRMLVAVGMQQEAVRSAKQEKIDQAIMEQNLQVMPQGRRVLDPASAEEVSVLR